MNVDHIANKKQDERGPHSKQETPQLEMFIGILTFRYSNAPSEKDCRFSQLLLKFSLLGHIPEDAN
jgi:hypothetical protein